MALPPIVGLEIGTSKIVALVGEIREHGRVSVTGLGEYSSIGVRKGRIVDFQNVGAGIRSALAAAEESGRVAVREVYVAFSGGDAGTLINRGTVEVRGRNREIGERDVARVIEEAQRVNLQDGRELLHTICQHFCVDGQEGVVQPVGGVGSALSLDMLVVHTSAAALQNAVQAVLGLRIEVADVAFTGLCSALAVLTPEQKKSGVVVADLGGGTTSYLAYEGDVIAVAGAVGMGGDHVTNDIALAFSLPQSRAEKMKQQNACATVTLSEASQTVDVPPELGFAGKTISRKALNTVVNLRMAEILNMVKAGLDARGLNRFGAGVVLTGGGARLRGVVELAERIFGLPCAVGRARGMSGLASVVEGSQYTACCGAILYGIKSMEPERGPRAHMLGWLKRSLVPPQWA